MRKSFIFVIILLCLTACDIKSQKQNDNPQVRPTQSVENNITQVKPTQSIENEISNEKPTLSVENNEVVNDKKTYEGITTPILIKSLLIGGLSDGTWMMPDEFYNSGYVNFDGFEYASYLSDRKIGKAKGIQPANWMTGELLEGNTYSDEYCIVDLYDNNNQLISYDIALDADWEVFPRPYEEQNANQADYLDMVIGYLTDYGIDDPQTTIKQVINVDLEGDGTKEVLIAADNTIDDQFDTVKRGDNAVLVFRKVVGDEVIDQIVDEDIRMNDEDSSIYRILFRVETIADLDGDSIMEVVVKSWYYEGIGWSIYKLRDNQLEFITANGLGA